MRTVSTAPVVRAKPAEVYRDKYIRLIPESEKGRGFQYSHVVLVGPGVLVYSIEEARQKVDDFYNGTLPAA